MLNFGVRVDALDGLRKTFQTVNADDENVFNASVLQVSQYAEPSVSAFLIRQVQPQEFLFAIDIQAKDGINGLAHVTTVFLNFVVNRIQPHDGVDGLQIAFTPGL